MKNPKKLFIFLASIVLLAVISVYIAASRTEIPIESNFPLKLIATIPFDDVIERLAVADTWMVVATPNEIIAIDLDTQKTRWRINFSIATFDQHELEIIGDNVIAVGKNQIIVIDKTGQTKAVNLVEHHNIMGNTTILELATVAPNNIYIIRDSMRTIEAYDLEKNKIAWSLPDGRGANIWLDSASNIAYIATTAWDTIRAVDNTTGDILWQQEKTLSASIYENGSLYLYNSNNHEDIMQVSAMDTKTQSELWKTQAPSVFLGSGRTTIINNLLIASGLNGMLAINKLDGKVIWTSYDAFYNEPVEFDGLIYIKDSNFRVEAISPLDGNTIGYVKLENPNPFLLLSRETNAGVHRFKDGIIFNLSNTVVIYKK